MSLGLRACAKRRCIEASVVSFYHVAIRSSSTRPPLRPPLPRSTDNRQSENRNDLTPIPLATDVQVTEGAITGSPGTAVALRQFWQNNFPSATFQNKDEFMQWYIKNSTILLFLIGGILLWKKFKEVEAPELIGPDHFTNLKVISRTKISPDSLLIQFELPKDALPPITEQTPTGLNMPVQSVYVADTDSMIQRPYTPLSAEVFDPTSRENTGKLSLLVKRYPMGEVSKWLHSRAVGATVPIRGPVWTWDLRQREVDDLIFIVGGTGITPAFQVLTGLYEAPELPKEQQELLFGKLPNFRLDAQAQAAQDAELDRFKYKVATIRAEKKVEPPMPSAALSRRPRITILYASPSTDAILLRKTLEAYADKHPDRVRVAFWADALAEPSHAKRVARIGRLEMRDLEKYGARATDYPSSRKTAVIVCGPESFIDALAGPRPRGTAAEKAVPLGGMLAKLGWKAEQVVRLDNAQHLQQSMARRTPAK